MDDLFSSVERFKATAYGRTGIDRLAGHLAQTYDWDVVSTTQLDGGVFRIDTGGAGSFVARVFPAARPLAAAETDAAVLAFVADHDYPAERVVEPAVSVHDAQPVLVTRFVDGTNLRGDASPATFGRLGTLLGALHTLPDRPWPAGGGWHSLSVHGGGRDADVAALRALLADVASRATTVDQAALETLRSELASLDVGDGLPRALTHPDFATPNAIRAPDGGLVLVDWTGAGAAPRIQSLGLLLACTGGNPLLVDAVMRGYRQHVTLEAEERERLPDAIRGFGLVLACWGIVYFGSSPHSVVAGLAAGRTLASTIAGRAR